MNTPRLFLDGECVLCSKLGRWVFKETREKVGIHSIQGADAQRFLRENGLGKPLEDAVYFWDGQRFFTSADAALKVVPYLGWRYAWLRVGWVFPRFLRNAIYRWVARNRKDWFGSQEYCELNEPNRSTPE
jgi:predicted DCC family thiol-disulfide oxidoreductase YuxK